MVEKKSLEEKVDVKEFLEGLSYRFDSRPRDIHYIKYYIYPSIEVGFLGKQSEIVTVRYNSDNKIKYIL